MRSATILGLTIVSFGLLPLACTQNFGFFASTQGTGGSSTASTSSSSGMMASSSSSSGGTGCMMDTDCNDQNVCTTDSCDTATGKCVNTAVSDGTPPGYVDTVMDCKTQMCVSGVEQTVAADTDVPPSGNPCVTNTCANQMVVPTNVTAGMGCGGTQTCDGMGNCVGCLMAGDCMNPGTCKSVACTANKCIISNDPVETTCNGGGGKVVCDGNGNCVGCATNGDCMSGNCTNNTCGLASDGHMCGGGGQCSSGHCVDAVCCDHSCFGTCQACTSALTGVMDGTCSNVKPGTPPSPANQCAAATCGNTGNCASGATCEQVAGGSNCGTGPMCVGNVFHPQQTCTAPMTCGGATQDCMTYKCASSGCPANCANDGQCSTGNYCMNPGASGTCVAQLTDGTACTTNDECQHAFCYGTPSVCQANSCGDNMLDGNETDVDCGGGTCPACGTGKMCAKGSDCMSTMCNAGHTCT